MLPNEVFALACRAYYDEQGFVVDATNGVFAHCPLPKGMGDKGYYLTWEHHQHQGLLQSKDVGRCCFFVGDAKRWLLECEYWPDNYFELWDIYEKYKSESSRVGAAKSHENKDERGKSILGIRNAERLLKTLHKDKDELGRSRHAVKAATAAAVVCSKPIEITFEGGEKKIYGSGRELAKLLGVSPASVTNWAKGKHSPSIPISVRYV
jgi:hypothetical protein